MSREQQALSDKLSQRELTFANLWLTSPEHGMSRAQCYIMSGFPCPSESKARHKAEHLLKRTNVWSYIRSMRLESVERTGLTLDYLDAQLKEVIDTSITDVLMTVAKDTGLIDEDTGTSVRLHVPVLKCSLQDLPSTVAQSIQGIKMTKEGVEIKLYNKLEAFKLAYQRQGALYNKVGSAKDTAESRDSPPLKEMTDDELDRRIGEAKQLIYDPAS